MPPTDSRIVFFVTLFFWTQEQNRGRQEMKINMLAADIAFGMCVAIFFFTLWFDRREKRELRGDDQE